MERRTLLKSLGGLVALPSLAAIAADRHRGKPALRIAHITDVHLKDEFDAPRHFTDCLHHLQRQTPAVDFILNGGDIVFDMNKENLGTIGTQWSLMHRVLREECSLPVYYALGNHDVWWYEDSKGDKFYGKKYSMGQLQLSNSYYSFEKGGWKFIVLDSVHLDIDNTWYIGKLGDEQFAWFKQQVEQTDSATPICVLSHIPILTATNLVQDNIVNRWELTGGDMHTDNANIIRLLYAHPNVKLCLSGHIHLRDKVVYDNVTFLCNGAVSGAWWKGNNRETAPGYGLIDLFADGTFDEKYVNY